MIHNQIKFRGLKTTLSTFLSILFLSISIHSFSQDVPSDEAAVAAGKKLFGLNCKSCHALNKKLIGPALAGVTGRYDTPWLIKWIRNNNELIKSGDPQAVALYDKYKLDMTIFPSLSDADILNILAYTDAGEPSDPEKGKIEVDPKNPTNNADTSSFNIILGVILVVLLLVIAVLILLTTVLLKTLKKKEEDEELDEIDSEFINNKTSLLDLIKNPIFIGVGGFLSTLVVLYLIIVKVLYGIGVSQGYAPEQPIAFSHKIHAGQYEIDCQYCHTGVRKSKNANIPSPNICMNCHAQIKTDSPEIKKIHKAIGYVITDKENNIGEYTGETHPIEWVRIHNLPDLAYFNHSQHVQVAGLACETCHGEIKEMDKVYQYAPLTMGWCINCHRETNVKAKGNEYYDKLLEIHENKNADEPMKVEDIGGLECAKCHY